MIALRRQLNKTPDEPAAQMLLPRERLEFVDETTTAPLLTWTISPDRVEP